MIYTAEVTPYVEDELSSPISSIMRNMPIAPAWWATVPAPGPYRMGREADLDIDDNFGKRHIRFAVVEITNLTVDAGVGADEVKARPLAIEIFKQGENGAFAIVERDVVKIIEDPCFFQFA